mgnify:CR=1 FL=1
MIIETTSDDYAALTSGRALRDYKSADSPIAPPEVLEMLAGVAAHVRETFSPASWLIVEGQEVVGSGCRVREGHYRGDCGRKSGVAARIA